MGERGGNVLRFQVFTCPIKIECVFGIESAFLVVHAAERFPFDALLIEMFYRVIEAFDRSVDGQNECARQIHADNARNRFAQILLHSLQNL